MKDFGEQLTVYYSQKSQANEKKGKAKRNMILWGVAAVILFFLRVYILALVDIAMFFVCLYYSTKTQDTQAQLEIWENGYVLKMKDGKVYRVRYEQASVPSVGQLGSNVLVKIWDNEAKKSAHLFEVESMEKGREICEMIDETAKKMGVSIS